MRGLRERPTVMKRWVNGVEGDPFFQKRVPDSAPEWLQTATVTFPSGRHARELVPNDAAHLVWGVNLGVIDWNPWPVRRDDLDHPDELRVDLDPAAPRCRFAEVRDVALGVREVLEEHDLRGFPKTSGSRGIHIYVRIEPSQSFEEVRRAALALAREVERRMPGRATSRWWKEEREGVFIDYNQNARDRTVASAYSVRAVADARVSCPLEWEEVADVEPADLRLQTVPARLRERGDPSAAHRRAPRSPRRAARAGRARRARRPRRRAVAAALSQAEERAAARPAEPGAQGEGRAVMTLAAVAAAEAAAGALAQGAAGRRGLRL